METVLKLSFGREVNVQLGEADQLTDAANFVVSHETALPIPRMSLLLSEYNCKGCIYRTLWDELLCMRTANIYTGAAMPDFDLFHIQVNSHFWLLCLCGSFAENGKEEVLSYCTQQQLAYCRQEKLMSMHLQR